jgi:hypothetical protein
MNPASGVVSQADSVPVYSCVSGWLHVTDCVRELFRHELRQCGNDATDQRATQKLERSTEKVDGERSQRSQKPTKRNFE